ncbi:MAG: hypothetical protein HY270_16415 [Deltaproteobacteria bacterium]|nr:hypothetical protein [Deltaproteobacteria bacterium]
MIVRRSASSSIVSQANTVLPMELSAQTPDLEKQAVAPVRRKKVGDCFDDPQARALLDHHRPALQSNDWDEV